MAGGSHGALIRYEMSGDIEQEFNTALSGKDGTSR